MKKNMVYLLLLATLPFSDLLSQEKVVVLGSSSLNPKTRGFYEEKVEIWGGKVIETFIDSKNPLMFVSYSNPTLKVEELIEKLEKNELKASFYVKEVQNSQQLQELGISSPKIFSYFQGNNTPQEKPSIDFVKEYEKEGKKYVRCDWAPFYYEVTGNPELDEKNYQQAKAKWVQENPKAYQNLNIDLQR